MFIFCPAALSNLRVPRLDFLSWTTLCKACGVLRGKQELPILLKHCSAEFWLSKALSLSLPLSILRVIFSTSILINLAAIHHCVFSCPLQNFILFSFSTRFLSLQSLPTLPLGNTRLVSIYHQLTGHKILLRLVSNHNQSTRPIPLFLEAIQQKTNTQTDTRYCSVSN